MCPSGHWRAAECALPRGAPCKTAHLHGGPAHRRRLRPCTAPAHLHVVAILQELADTNGRGVEVRLHRARRAWSGAGRSSAHLRQAPFKFRGARTATRKRAPSCLCRVLGCRPPPRPPRPRPPRKPPRPRPGPEPGRSYRPRSLRPDAEPYMVCKQVQVHGGLRQRGQLTSVRSVKCRICQTLHCAGPDAPHSSCCARVPS